MFKEERRHAIINLLTKDNSVSVSKLSDLYKVSQETIRSDLRYFQKSGMLQRCYGGGILNRDALSKLITENKIDISSTIATPIHQDAKLRRENTKKAGKVCVLGSFNIDVSATVPWFPQSGESILASQFGFYPGGKGANQALAANNAGAAAHFIFKVGKDQFSALIYVSAVDGDNIIAIYPGANMMLTTQEINEQHRYIAESDVMLMQLETNIEALTEFIRLGKQENKMIMLNPAPYTKQVTHLLSDIDIITPNETEASFLSGVTITDINDAKKAGNIILQSGVKKVIITLGARGSLLCEHARTLYIPAWSAVVKDAAGAGDAFNGALAAALARQADMVAAIQYASAFASLAVEQVGASSMPQHLQVLHRMRTQSNKVININ
ncbi:PfkB family carbohydrate kinase [Salmonella enterica]|uniref:Ribokinase n=1 Tax=Salmonella enterica subsp. enterica serovar Napoli TaxID=1151001 RepID=A0A5H6J9K0_SALET|nr:PfkB family carbohydrate kinase [Salmonella enterica]EDV0857489.1 DeoR family transcriptional regulator [Salmonella enterica subsp. enterica]AXB19702.1 Ribokinase [Salmonella enterica subsp. enterica serovar Napoli]EAN0773745.1 DeoR family transcriptional regulator [Salmonella enterica]EAN2629331.1 DeoR family transcriptional regulator [Salmonella enterica]EAV6327787.1 DeoR family transcriptional regulator [Salmonella enterica subsp. enterica serovar Napoli]